MNNKEFIAELSKLGISITAKQLSDLETYYQLLVEENKKYNLTAITEKEDVYLKHFYDSLTIVNGVKLDNQYILDIGSGAGFPGMVLKIVFPNIKIDLLDSTFKKCKFLNLVIKTLDLKNITVINDRAEIYSRNNREKYDLITARAVAPLKHLLEYAIPMLKINGTFVALKGTIDTELENIDNYYKKLYLNNPKAIEFKLPYENSNRTIYTVNKYDITPTIYPREYKQIKKKDI